MPWRFNPFTGNLDETDIPAFNGEVTLGSAASPSIFFTGDPNTGIYSPGADQVAISTNGTGRLFVDANGNVGISEATPVYYSIGTGAPTLVFKGTSVSTRSGGASFITQDGTSGKTYLYHDAGLFRIQSETATSIRFDTDNTERLRITSDGKLGLGTSVPATALDVVGQINATTGFASSRFAVNANPLDTTSTAQSFARFTSTGGDFYIGTESSTAGGFFSGSTAYAACLYNSAATPIQFFTGGAIRATLNSTGLGVGTTSPGALFHCSTSGNFYGRFESTNADAGINLKNPTRDWLIFNSSAGALRFYDSTAASDRVVIDTSGRLLVGTSSAREVEYTPGTAGIPKLQVEGDAGGSSQILITDTRLDGRHPQLAFAKTRNGAIVASDDILGSIGFFGDDGTDTRSWGGRITCEVDGTPGANDMPGRLVFSVTEDGSASPTEAFAITNDRRNWVFDARSLKAEFDTTAKLNIYSGSSTSTGGVGIECAANTGSARYHIAFSDNTGVVGSISTSGGATAYNTSSDYRLKENVVPLTGAIDRINQLQVHRFNFIANPDTAVDGFLAHEVQAVVPECVTGSKDEVDENGNPVYQGIDQSKLVPLLTAALQEAIGEIESLKARVAALESA